MRWVNLACARKHTPERSDPICGGHASKLDLALFSCILRRRETRMQGGSEERALIGEVARKIAGRYTVEAELAVGGMGAVYRVHDESSGRTLALKRLLPD